MYTRRNEKSGRQFLKAEENKANGAWRTTRTTQSKSNNGWNHCKRLLITTQNQILKEVKNKYESYLYDDCFTMMCFWDVETILLCQPPAVSISRSEQQHPESVSISHLHPPSAPIITHTAATPQGSPNATLDSISSRDSLSRLSPKSALAKLQGRSSDTSLHRRDANSLVNTDTMLAFGKQDSSNHSFHCNEKGLETSPKLMRTLSSRSSRRSSLTPSMPTKSILSRKCSLAAPPWYDWFSHLG